ncbi:MAG: NADH-quinone oxidoreductase subunit L [Spirosomataceae bacterium]
MIALIPLFPLIGFLINGLGFRKVPKNLVGIIGSGATLASFAISLTLFLGFSGEPQTVKLFDWITVGKLNISFSFLVDQLTLLMLLIITGVGSLIHIYSIGYMHDDEGFGKFFAFLNLFLFFMLLLVMGSSYVMMFIGWEGVGLCSYLLIGFWNKNTAYNNAARKAFIMNRIGDLGYLLGIFLIINTFGSAEYSDVLSQAAKFQSGDKTLMWITLLLFVGAMGKSAQIPLYTWLPDAMAGPTPVSALIHAATMVTAGVYMVARSNVMYALSPVSSQVVAVVGLATAIFAATIGLKQNDIKKVLAYSTVSQLGYMFVSLGVGAYTTAMFHVTTHAFFKALLFLGAGSVIHAMSGEQDIRKMGGLRKALPITHLTFLIGTLAIAGFPPLSGFFSKDEILAATYSHSLWMFTVLAVTSVISALYMFRLYWLTFWGDFRGTHEQEHHLHESPSVMTLPLIVLAVLSFAGGFVGMPEIFHVEHVFNKFLMPIIQFGQEHEVSHFFEYCLIGVSIVALIIITLGTYSYYVTKRTMPEAHEADLRGYAKVLYNKYYIDELYDAVFVKPIKALSNFCYSVFEFLVIDLLVEGIGKLVKSMSNEARSAQDGSIGFYLFAMVMGIVAVMAYSLRFILLK